MDKPKVIFLGTPDFAGDILEVLINKNIIQVPAIWTKPPLPKGRGQKIIKNKLMTLAEKYNIDLHTDTNINDHASIVKLDKYQPDLALIVAYGKIIKPDFYTVPRLNSVNLHFSLLPKHRGASPVQASILNGDTISGITLQAINEKMDEGDVILQRSFSIENMNAPSVFDLALKETDLLFTDFFWSLEDHLSNKKIQTPSEATYCRKISKESGKIELGDSIYLIEKRFRAYDPWPGVFFYLDGIKYEIKGISEIISNNPSKPGLLDTYNSKCLSLSLKDGYVIIDRIKKEGKKEMDTASFLNGSKITFPVLI